MLIHKPVPVPFDEERMQAPHLAVLVYMRGLLRHLITRMYLPGEPAIAADPVLELVPQDRRHTLIARHNPQSPAAWSGTSCCREKMKQFSSHGKAGSLA